MIVPSGPFLPDWNFRILHEIFRLIPHSSSRDTAAEFLTLNSLASTWIYAAVFYLYWRIEDARAVWRRIQLLETFVAFCLAMLATLVIRPWVGWAAPNVVPRFQVLYPECFWGQGNSNCFPSHSTLAYLIVAAGFWTFKRSLSGILMFLTLVLISLPRVYVGGHYPIDILAAIILAGLAVWSARPICAQPSVRALLTRIVSKGVLLEGLLFLWLFELAEGFRSSYSIAMILLHTARTFRR